MVMMQQKTLDGKETENFVYNAAANITTAVLGGPEILTSLIHKRDSSFAPVHVRRYMLDDRKPGDNDCTAAALGALYSRLASRKLAGIDEKTMDTIHAALVQKAGSRWYAKDGRLTSDPLTEVRAGWWATPKGPVVYVVMAEQSVAGAEEQETAGKRLGKTADSLALTLSVSGIAAVK